MTLINRLRSRIGESDLDLPTAWAALCGDRLIATLDDEPSEHDGKPFIFKMGFSEKFPLSLKTLEDGAFIVTNGGVTKAKRVERGNNRDWLITVEPVSDGDVTIRMPGNRDCDEPGAIVR